MSTQATPGGPTRLGEVLHVGCGFDPLPSWLAGAAETRLDIDPRCSPDIVASMTDLGDVGPFDLVYSCHSLEHLFPHEVAAALSEFRRVLRPGGRVVVIVPDLEGVCATDEVLFQSPAGPVSGLDLIYGLRAALAAQPHMGHRTGFVAETLRAALVVAGLTDVATERHADFNLLAVGSR